LGIRQFLDESPEAAPNTKLVLVGPEDRETAATIADLGLTHYVDINGTVSYEKSIIAIAEASVCILIEARLNESIFFPSKLADYLASGKPVLALSPSVSFTAELADRGELIRTDPQSPGAVSAAIRMLYSEHQSGRLCKREPSADLQKRVGAEHVAGQFLAVCERLKMSHMQKSARVF
jgi:glycosyltransferase involved in cell wall biosynthesis